MHERKFNHPAKAGPEAAPLVYWYMYDDYVFDVAVTSAYKRSVLNNEYFAQ